MSFCWFCHEAAQTIIGKILQISGWKPKLSQYELLSGLCFDSPPLKLLQSRLVRVNSLVYMQAIILSPQSKPSSIFETKNVAVMSGMLRN